MLQTAYLFLHISDSHLPPILSLLRGEGGPGVRESRHLQTGPAAVRRSPGTRGLLCHPLCGCIREGGPQDKHLRDPPAGGEEMDGK